MDVHKPELLTVAEFRKQMKTALDYCVQGGTIQIERMGQRFILMHQPHGTSFAIGRVPKKNSELNPDNLKPRSTKEMMKAADDLFADETIPVKNTGDLLPGYLEKPCCKLKKPCKHWGWDDNQLAWVNTLTGETRETV